MALRSRLHPGHEEAYERDHAVIPDDLVAAFDRVGIHSWTIWREGLDLFHLVDCDDFGAALAALADDPADRRWQAFIGVHVAAFLPDGRPSPLHAVWSLDEQRDAG